MRKSKSFLPPFLTGQIWQMAGSQVEIGVVGKRLVHYRHFKPLAKRPSVQLSGKAALEQFLRTHDAILLKPPPPSQTAGQSPAPSGRALQQRVARVEEETGDAGGGTAVVIPQRSGKV